MNTATQTGAASKQTDPDVKSDEIPVRTRSEREIMLDALGDQQDEIRRAGIDEGVAADPGAASMQARIAQQQAESRSAAEAAGLLEPIEQELGVASIKAMHPESKDVRTDLPKKLRSDPLADNIVMDGDTPMFELKVNGQRVLMPLDEAKRKLQIRTAAEIDLRNAREYQKRLDARAYALDASEEALRARVTSPNLTAAPAPAGLSDEEIQKEATAVFKTAFSGTEEEAAAQLTKLLLKIRTPSAVLAPPIDISAITRNAANAAVGAVTDRENKKDLVSGLNTFKDMYPEIISDPVLYRMADDMTDDIVVEHPEWLKSQVMLEAGKRTRRWVDDLKGIESTNGESNVAAKPTTSSQTPPPTAQDRQVRKTGLVRIPQAAAGAVAAPHEVEAEQPQSPQQAFEAVRKARGQSG